METNTLKILMVEDDEDDVQIIKDLLRGGLVDTKLAIDHATTADDALMRAAAIAYDVCMFDYRLGQMDGIELLQMARARGITSPIIFLTGQGDQEVAVQAMKAGATDYLVKGNITAESLSHSIRYAISLYREGKQRQEAEEKLKRSHEDLMRAHQELQESMVKLRAAQNQILRSEKLASIGRLAAGVCHEVLNPLNIISGHVQVLAMERAADAPLQDDLRSIGEEILRIEKIVGGLLKFSRKSEMDFSLTNIHDELDSIMSIIEKEMALQSIIVIRHFNTDLPKIEIDSDRMRQVFLNIVNNARYAIGNGGGALTISTEFACENADGAVAAASYSPEMKTATSTEDGCYLRIRFTDTGAGIKKEDLGKIFDPFFTTKPEDKGTGLGLSVCHSIIEKHGGRIEAESEPGKGASFIIDLPLGKRPRIIDAPEPG